MKRKTKSFLISFLLLFATFFGVSAFNTTTAKAEETPTLYNLTVTEGVANVDDVAVTQATEGTLVTLVANEKENYRFEYWQIVAGENVSLADATAMQTTFYMPACDVEITAVYECLVLSEINFTITAPMHGEYFDNVATSLEPELYTVEISEVRKEPVLEYNSVVTPFDTSNPYEAGTYYYYSFNFTFHDGRTMDANTKILVNGQEANYDSRYGGHYYRFETLYPITVINGEAFADDGFTVPITHIRKNGTFYIKADQTQDDLSFNSWSIEGKPRETGDVFYYMLRIRQGEELLVVTAVYSKKHKITVVGGKASMTEATYGRTPRLTLTYVPEGAVFSHWTLNGEKLKLHDGDRFVMPDEEALIEAAYHYHTYDATVTFNETHHWNQCSDENCLDLNHSIKNKVEHPYDHDCDTTCNDGCGYERTITHVYEETWTSDAYQHWHACSTVGCGEFIENLDHEFKNGVCTICNHECEHAGGEATCLTSAVCSICDESYGEVNVANHEQPSYWVVNAHTHVKVFNCCQAYDGEEANHTFENGACEECQLSQANVIDTVTVNGVFAPYISQNVSYYLTAIENAILSGEITINDTAYNSQTQTFGNIRLIDVKVVKSTGEAVNTVAFRKDSYNLHLTLAPIDGYYFFNELSINVTVNGENAASIEKSEEELTVYSPAFEITSNAVDTVTFEGVLPPKGMTVAEYYEYARSVKINGSTDENSMGVYGPFNLVEGYLADSSKKALDGDTIITENVYYFYIVLEMDSNYRFASRDNLVVIFDDTDIVTFTLYSGELTIYAQYDLRHPCEDISPADHVCDICGEPTSDCKDEDTNHVCDICGATGIGTHEQADGKHTCDYCGETLSSCVDTEPKDHVCDICGATGMGTHEQADGKHTCDYCGETMSSCVDTNEKDHVCDICGEALSDCEDEVGDGFCDYCENEMPSSEPESNPIEEPESNPSIEESNSTADNSETKPQADFAGCQGGCMGSIAGSGMTTITLLGLCAMVFLRKKR